MFLIFDFKTCNASEVLSTSGSIARPIDVIYKFVIGTMAVIKNKTHAALVDPLKFVTVSLAAIMSNNWAVVEAREKKGTGADPGSFLGGRALVSCSTSTPINTYFFFFCRIPVVLENRRSSQGRGGCAPPAPSP